MRLALLFRIGEPIHSFKMKLSMRQAFPKVAVVITALVYVGFAFWLGSTPAALLGAFQIEQSTPQMLTEIRAFYGGIELGIAFSMFALLWRGELFSAALAGGLPLAGSVLGRLSGQFLDGHSLATHSYISGWPYQKPLVPSRALSPAGKHAAFDQHQSRTTRTL